MVVAGTTISKPRLERYAGMTLPIGDATVALVKRADDKSITKPSDIQGKVVASMKGSAQLLILQDYVKTLPGGVAEVKAYIGSSNAYADLAAGDVFWQVATLAAQPALSAKDPANVRDGAADRSGRAAYLAWVLPKKPETVTLLDAINAEIKKFDQDGTIKELQIKWFGKDVALPYENIPPPTY